jgi:hypothetical protein
VSNIAEKIQRLEMLMPFPDHPNLVSESDWLPFENKTGLIFPDEAKVFFSVYGCGAVDGIFSLTAPMCFCNPGETKHESNIYYWGFDCEQRQHDDLETPPLYPTQGGVYFWGHSGGSVSFGWHTGLKDNKAEFLLDKIVGFYSTKPHEYRVGFLDFVFYLVTEGQDWIDPHPREQRGIHFYQPWPPATSERKRISL